MVIAVIEKKPEQPVIDILRIALAMAERGEIVSAAIAMVDSDGCTSNVFTTMYPIRILGEMEILKRDIIDLACDTRLHQAGVEY